MSPRSLSVTSPIGSAHAPAQRQRQHGCIVQGHIPAVVRFCSGAPAQAAVRLGSYLVMGKASCVFSKGITLSSLLIRTHAPDLHPPSDFGFSPYSEGLCRLLPAPAA